MTYPSKPGGGKTTAILAAGPLFLMIAPIAIWQTQPDLALSLIFDWRVIVTLVPLAVMAIIVGGVIACIPVILGAIALEALGRANVGCRLVAFWGLIGAAMAGLPAMLLDCQMGWATLALALTGATCALICRHGVSWDDDTPLSGTRSPAIGTRYDT